MSLLLLLLYLGILCSFTETKNQKNADSSSIRNPMAFLNILRNSESENSNLMSPQQGNIKDGVFENLLRNETKPATVLEKFAFHNADVKRNDAEESRSLEALKREYFLQLHKVALNNEVEMKNTVYSRFDEKSRRYHGYKQSRAEDYPYAVFVIITPEREETTYSCAGSVLSSQWVLTVAHCLKIKKTKEVHVYAGGNSITSDLGSTYGASPNFQFIEAQTYLIHPNYTGVESEGDQLYMMYNVALVKVALKLTRYVKTVELAKVPSTHGDYLKCSLTGFGKVYFEKVDPEDFTRKTHDMEINSSCPCITKPNFDIVLCSRLKEGYGICTSDSGGGLVCNGKVVAIAYVMMTIEETEDGCEYGLKECRTNETFSVFLKIDPYLSWIDSVVNGASSSYEQFIIVVVLLLSTVYQNFV